jgi:hypothetical protein
VFHKGRERGQQEQDTSVLDVQSAAGNEEINSSLSALRDICLEKKQSASVRVTLPSEIVFLVVDSTRPVTFLLIELLC